MSETTTESTVTEEKAVMDRADKIIEDLSVGRLRGSKRDEVGRAVDRSKTDEAAGRAIRTAVVVALVLLAMPAVSCG
jgi:hypothetical protein